jgi:MFS-type transporter involved in bile tolerance (Atg22 family)
MLFLVLFWVTIFGRSSWASAVVTVLGMMFAVAAAIGAVLGTWLGKRRRSPGSLPRRLFSNREVA